MLIDTSIFLEILLDQKRAEESDIFLKRVHNGEIKAFVTDFIIDSILVTMESKKVPMTKMRNFLLSLLISQGLAIYQHEIIDRLAAVKTMEEHKLTFDDAINVIALKALDIKEIVSFDTDFDGLPGIKRLEPKDVIIAEVERIAKMVGKKMPKGKTSVDLIREERD